MKVKCVRSFVGHAPNGRFYSPGMGDEFELPDGVDWLQAGFVVPVKETKQETATQPKPRRRTSRTRSKQDGTRSK